MPSSLEAQGLVVIESLACGTPVVTLEGGAPSEVVAPGVGATCPPTADGLAAACAEALRLAAKPETRAACRAHAAAWDWDTAIVPRTLEVYSR
jgi:glycosyltransferase involved in cell wall biosynthesis